MGLVAGCASDETPDEPVVSQAGDAAGQETPAPEMAAQRAVVAPENAKWEAPADQKSPDQQAAQAAAAQTPGALMPRPLTPSEQTASMEQAERRYLQGEKPVPGVNLSTPAAPLVAPPASTEARLSALEGQVSDLRKEFSSMLPAIRALIAEKDQSTKTAMSVASAAAEPVKPTAPPAASAPTPAAEKKPVSPLVSAPSSPAPAAPPPSEVAPAAGASGSVGDLRIGIHPDKTRIVFDVSSPVAAGQDLDNGEKLFIVDLPGMIWKGPAQKTLSKESIVSSWTAQPSSDGKGSTVAFQLRGPAKILSSTQLKPAEGKGNRIVIDLAAE